MRSIAGVENPFFLVANKKTGKFSLLSLLNSKAVKYLKFMLLFYFQILSDILQLKDQERKRKQAPGKSTWKSEKKTKLPHS